MDPLSSLTDEQRLRFEGLLALDRTVEAIRLLRDETGLDVGAAEAYVSGRRHAGPSTPAAATGAWLRAGTSIDGTHAAEIDACLRSGQKIRAIQVYRTATGAGLADAKYAVEVRAAELSLGEMPTARGAAKTGGCFGIVILAFVGAGLGLTLFPEVSRALR
jgi:ribosomal protein L7/L12